MPRLPLQSVNDLRGVRRMLVAFRQGRIGSIRLALRENDVTEVCTRTLEQHLKAVETNRHALEVLVLALLESVPITADALDRALLRLYRDLPSNAAAEAETRVRYLIDAVAGGEGDSEASAMSARR
jgi:hypothetical protein